MITHQEMRDFLIQRYNTLHQEVLRAERIRNLHAPHQPTVAGAGRFGAGYALSVAYSAANKYKQQVARHTELNAIFESYMGLRACYKIVIDNLGEQNFSTALVAVRAQLDRFSSIFEAHKAHELGIIASFEKGELRGRAVLPPSTRPR